MFDRSVAVALPASLKIFGQCSIVASNGFVSSFVCIKTSDNAISITADFDNNLMISQNYTYTITITNVSTPVSTAPLTYTI